MSEFESSIPETSKNFEAPPDEPEPGEQDQRRSLFDKIYKSRTAKVLALAATLGIGGKLIPAEKVKFHEPEKKYEVSAEHELELGDLHERFASEVEIPNSEHRYVLHIAQIHGSSSMNSLRGGLERKGVKEVEGEINNIIEAQKELEQLLLYLSDEHDLNDVYIEGLLEEDINALQMFKNNIIYGSTGQLRHPPERWNKATGLYHYFKNEVPDLTERFRAELIYMAQQTLVQEREQMAKAYEAHREGNNDVREDFAKLFQLWEEEGINYDTIDETLKKYVEEIANDEIIQDDRLYTYQGGAAMKLYLEGKINVHPAETYEANREAFSKYPGGEIIFTKQQLEDPKEQERFRRLLEERVAFGEQGSNLREDTALEIISQNPHFENQKYIPLVYGKGHNFSDNVEKFNKKSSIDVGLIRIELKDEQ